MRAALKVFAPVALGIVLAALLWGRPSHGQGLPAEGLINHLQQTYQETVRGSGILHDGSAQVLILVSPAGTYSILIVSTAGVAYPVISGRGWEYLPAPKGDPS